ncbi:CbtB-domain containing protein [Caballeronia sp. Lep1P3]|uniref:CbtB domain-containing protein n=1 Tax=Caballeronia sp. Lep1P3 TaxID=2878150 RepID=UPI001FD2085F|nr:CbtB-domain containing protein [Caballeronia sp. Lep1P3]
MNASSHAPVYSAASASPSLDAPVPIPVREVLPWAVFIGLILLIAIYFVGAEQGATSIFSGMYVHEFVHDGRHLLGFPCH